MSKLSKLSSAKRFDKLTAFESPKDLAGMVAWLKQMVKENPVKQFTLNDDEQSIQERKADPKGWALLAEAMQIVNFELQQTEQMPSA
jgi:hypothetical protein